MEMVILSAIIQRHLWGLQGILDDRRWSFLL